MLDCVGHPHCVSMPFLLLGVTEGDRKRGWNDRPCASRFESPDLSRLSSDGKYRWTAAEPGKRAHAHLVLNPPCLDFAKSPRPRLHQPTTRRPRLHRRLLSTSRRSLRHSTLRLRIKGPSSLHRAQSLCPLRPRAAIPPISRPRKNPAHPENRLGGRRMRPRRSPSMPSKNPRTCFHRSRRLRALFRFSSRTMMLVIPKHLAQLAC